MSGRTIALVAAVAAVSLLSTACMAPGMRSRQVAAAPGTCCIHGMHTNPADPTGMMGSQYGAPYGAQYGTQAQYGSPYGQASGYGTQGYGTYAAPQGGYLPSGQPAPANPYGAYGTWGTGNPWGSNGGYLPMGQQVTPGQAPYGVVPSGAPQYPQYPQYPQGSQAVSPQR